MRIRPATEDDALAIGRVQVETWRAAYRSIVADATLAGLSPTERAHQWRDLLADRSGARFVVRTQPIDIAGQTLTEVAYGWSNLSALLGVE